MLRHLLNQADTRFAESDELLFLLFNQLQRHAAVHTVNARIASAPQAMETFTQIVTQPTFAAQLGEALRNPEAPEARALQQQLMPLVRVAGASVPYSAAERALGVSQLTAMLQLFGLPTWFVTIHQRISTTA